MCVKPSHHFAFQRQQTETFFTFDVFFQTSSLIGFCDFVVCTVCGLEFVDLKSSSKEHNTLVAFSFQLIAYEIAFLQTSYTVLFRRGSMTLMWIWWIEFRKRVLTNQLAHTKLHWHASVFSKETVWGSKAHFLKHAIETPCFACTGLAFAFQLGILSHCHCGVQGPSPHVSIRLCRQPCAWILVIDSIDIYRLHMIAKPKSITRLRMSRKPKDLDKRDWAY